MKDESATSYVQQYAEVVEQVTERYERLDMVATQVMHAAWAMGGLLMLIVLINTRFDSQICFALLCSPFFLWGALNLIRGVILRPSNNDFKNQIVGCITHDEHPAVRYSQKGVLAAVDDVARLYGVWLRKHTEDFFEGTTETGYNFKCCECKIETGGKRSKVFFQGYVWSIDLGRGYRPREEVLHFVQEIIAARVDGELKLMPLGNCLIVAIHTGKNLFELDGCITEEMLHKVARDIDYVVTLPSLLPLDTFVRVRK